MEKIVIPETKEYGWVLNSEGKKVFKPNTKAIHNRVRFIVESRGAKLEVRTLGFSVDNESLLTKTDIEMIAEETRRITVNLQSQEGDVYYNESGREEPNFE